MSSSSSSSSSCNWVYDIFPSFRGSDVRKAFLGHFLKEFDRKLISSFRDNKIETSESLDPVLKQAIKDSKIAIVVFSQNYASSSWCLNELLEIVNCQKQFGQTVIPVFYDLDPSHVRHQVGDFGKVFKKTCRRKTKDEIQLWRKALTDVANLVGYHSQCWQSETTMIEVIANDVLGKLNLTPPNDFKDLVGIEDHISKMSLLLPLEPKEVIMVGIWGPSGIGKTTIARALYGRLYRHFQGRIFIDRRFISESIKDYHKGNPTDQNMKLHLQENFLSKILDKQGIEVNNLGAVKGKLKHLKVLIFIDDLDDQVVLEALADGVEWFGPGSRIVAITKDMQILRGHGIESIYEVSVPSKTLALQMFCQSAFRQNSPPDDFMELASEVAERIGGLPLGLSVIGSYLRGRKKSFWENMLPTLRKGLDGKIEKALRVSYDALEREEYKALFRHIACFFNGYEISNIKLMLADSELNVDIGIDLLVDKSLIHVIPYENDTAIVEMHSLVQEMGKEIVRKQSDKLGKREFLMDSKDVCNVLKGCTGTEKVLGLSMDLDEVDKVQIHENAFEGMTNLHFLIFYRKSLERKNEVRWDLPEILNYFPGELKLLIWPEYQMECLPSKFCPEYLVELRMPNSKLKKLWKDVKSLKCLKVIDLSESQDLEEIPDLSKAVNLETLNLHGCSSLVELPYSIQNLNELTDLNMAGCIKLEALPNGINLQSLIRLVLTGCSKLKLFPDISSRIESLIANKTAFQVFPPKLHLENLVELNMEQILSDRLWEGVQPLTSLKKIVLSGSYNLQVIPNLSLATSLEKLNLNGCSSLVELTSIHNLHNLTTLEMIGCSSLKSLPTDINLKSLYRLSLNGCSSLRHFPDISSNVSLLYLNQTSIEEVPPWINNFSSLEALEMLECKELKYISPSLFKLQYLDEVLFSDCNYLAEVRWPEEEAEEANDNITNFSLISFINCFSSNQEDFIKQSAFEYLILPGEVSPHFTYRSTSNSFTIPLHHYSMSMSQQPSLDFLACVVVSDLVVSKGLETVNTNKLCFIDIEVHCQFIDKHGAYFKSAKPRFVSLYVKYNHQIIFDCHFPLNQEYVRAEVQFRLPSKGLKLKGCGMRLSDESTQTEVDESIADVEEECRDNSDDEGYETAFDDEEEFGEDNYDGEI